MFPSAPPSVSSLVNGSIIYGVVFENVTIQFVLTNAGVPSILSNDTQWVFNESESLEEGSGIIFSDDRLSLTLTNLSFTNEGNYTITITNPAGTDSASLFLDVEGISKMINVYGFMCMYCLLILLCVCVYVVMLNIILQDYYMLQAEMLLLLKMTMSLLVSQ